MDEKLFFSRYTYMFVSSLGKSLIYNSRTNSFLEIDSNLYNQLLECKEKQKKLVDLDNKIVDLLRNRKIIVSESEDDDFLLELQYETDRSSYSKYILGLSVVPTLACNFSCHYCFEEHKRKVTMSEDTEDILISFINSHQESQKLYLNWYGGEPLLAINTIERLLEKISKDVKMALSRHTLITNGYLINDKVISVFKKYPLDIIQVTLDGCQERHNAIRNTRNDQPTYERIVNNIGRILNEFHQTQVHVRVNIEKSNIEDYCNVARELKEKWNNERLIVYPGFLRIDNDTKTAYSCNSLNRKEIADFVFRMKDKNVVDIPIYPQMFAAKTCSANRQCAYIVGPEGEVYKCWNDVGDSQRVVGSIYGNKITNKALLSRYIVGSKWHNDSNCKKCFFLPICNGTCAWYVLRNQYEAGQYNLCTCMQKAPGMLDKCLEYYYDSKSEKK